MNTPLEIIAEIERGLPLLGLNPASAQWLSSQLNTLRVAATPTSAPAPSTPPPDYGQNTAPGFEVGPGWLVSMTGTGFPNVWVPKNTDGTPNFTGLIAAGNPSGPNTGLYGLAYASMTPEQQAAYVAAIQQSGAQFT